jgi:tRNA G18 (ribose-2'-O)-methylase SpoU
MPFIPITDASDPRLEDYRNVPDPELVERRGIFVAEGRLVVTRLLQGRRFVTRSVLVTETARAALAGVLDERGDVPVFVVAPWIINAVTGFNIHRGCLAIGERPPARAWQDGIAANITSADATLASTPAKLLVVERVGNADNIGALFRNAAAFGADAVLLDDACADPLYRKAIRTSMGAALQVPFARIAPWPDSLAALRDAGYALVGLTPGATDTITAVASGVSRKKLALLVGHEGDGLSDAALAACTHRARIPMAPAVDSLNVATAAAIVMYECF